MAVKGASIDTRDIFSAPRVIDVNDRHKAAKYGLGMYMVGVSRAKDLILGGDGGGRLKLTGAGPGRLHWYRDVRPDYFEQLTSEVKAPAPGGRRGAKLWQKKAGKRNEALDAEIYALHAARAVRMNVFTEATWSQLERQIMQVDLLGHAPTPPAGSPGDGTAVAQNREPKGKPPQFPARKNWVQKYL